MYRIIRKKILLNRTFVLYLITGGLVTFSGFLLLFILVEYFHFDKNVAFFVQTIINLQLLFILNNWLVWSHRKTRKGVKPLVKRWVKFHFARAFIVILGQLLFFVLSLKINYLVSNVLVVIISTFSNYSLNEKFVFQEDKFLNK